jgi:hypothetical protein
MSSTTRPAYERTFAEQLEKNEAVKVYAKLPGWFKVPTPLGQLQPRLGGARREPMGPSASTSWSKPKAACLPTTSRDKEERQDRMRQGALPGIGGSRDTGSICGGPNR